MHIPTHTSTNTYQHVPDYFVFLARGLIQLSANVWLTVVKETQYTVAESAFLWVFIYKHFKSFERDQYNIHAMLDI